MSDAMENLMTALFMDQVPNSWAKYAWPSRKALNGWLTNFMSRLLQLEDWSNNPTEIPKVTVLSYLINPQSTSGVLVWMCQFLFDLRIVCCANAFDIASKLKGSVDVNVFLLNSLSACYSASCDLSCMLHVRGCC